MADFQVVARLMANVSDFKSGMSQAASALKELQQQTGSSFDKIGKTMRNVGGGLTAGVTMPLLALGGYAVKTAAQFEAGMSKVEAISGATAEEMVQLSNVAQEMGRTTKFSAVESADALSYMAMAGWNAEQMTSGLPGVMHLAAASGEDLARTSDIVTDALTAFGMKAEDSSRFADVLAMASSRSNTTVSQLGESFKYVAPLAGTLGFTAEDTAVALGLMANAGIKGSQAGTSLKTSFARLAAPTKQVTKGLNNIGLSIDDVTGKPLDQVLRTFRGAFADLDETQQAQAASMIFGKEAMSGMLAIINASEEDYDSLTDAINNSSGAAKDMADTMEDNLSGSITKLKSAIEGAAISIGSYLVPYVRKAVEWINKMVDKFNSLSEEQKKNIVKWALIAAAIGPVLIILGTLFSAISKIGMGFKTIAMLVKSVIGVFGVLKGAVLSVIGVLGSITAPVWAIIAVIAALIAVVVYLWNTNEDFRNGVIAIWESIKEVVMNVAQAIGEWLQKIGSWLGELFQKIAEGDWSGAWNMIKDAAVAMWNSLLSFISNIWESIKSAVKTGIDALPGIISSVGGFLMSAWTVIWEGIKTFVSDVWEGIKTVISSAINAVGPLITAGGELIKSAWDTIWNGLKDGMSAIWEGISSAVTSGIEGIGTILGDIGSNISEAWTNLWNGLTETISGWVTGITDILSPVVDTIGNIWNGVADVTGKAWDGVSGAVGGAWDWITGKTSESGQATVVNAQNAAQGVNQASAGIDQTTAYYQAMAQNSSSAISQLATDAAAQAQAAKSNVTSEASAMNSEASNQFSSMNIASAASMIALAAAALLQSGLIKTTVTNNFKTMKTESETSLKGISTAMKNTMNSAKTAASSGIESIKSTWTSGLNSIKSATSSAFNTVVSNVRSAMSSVVSALNSAAGQARSAGYNMGAGFYSGLAGMAGSIISLAYSIASRAAAAMRSALRIHSPSRVTDAIGNFTGEGFVNGIKAMVKPAEKMAARLGLAGVPTINPSDITGELNRLTTGQLNTGYTFNGGNLTVQQQPAYITLQMGNSEFRTFSRDITHQQQLDLVLEGY